MKLYSLAALTAALAAPAFCQEPPPAPPAPVPMEAQAAVLADQASQMAAQAQIDSEQMENVQAQIAQAADMVNSGEFAAKIAQARDKALDLQSPDVRSKLDELKFKLDAIGADGEMAFLQGKVPPAPPAPPAPFSKVKSLSLRWGDGEYDSGTRALDQHHYEEAVQHFDQVIDSKSNRADGALYWKAYALNRAGKRDDALAAIAQLRKDYATSAWLNDAQALETEVKQSSGQPVSPADESNEDIKLLAINSLMSADADRAIPLIEGILKGNSPPRVKRNALFVMAQSKSPRAQQIILGYAKGGGNPDLQLQAIQYLGMSGTREVQQQLSGIYGTVTDPRVKSTIIQSLVSARAYDLLLNIAKTEKDPNLRMSALRRVAESRNVSPDSLVELYNSSDAQGKIAIVDGLQSRREAKTMVDLARKETDPAVKRKIVERLGSMHDNKDAMDYMMELLK